MLTSTGCTTVEQNILAFRASSLPQGQWGYFLAAPTQAFIPFVGGSGGNLCLGPPLGRYASQVNSTGTLGELTLMVNVETIPTPGGPHHAQPGETWNFQAWYRDMNPGPTSNFTDAISVTWR